MKEEIYASLGYEKSEEGYRFLQQKKWTFLENSEKPVCRVPE